LTRSSDIAVSGHVQYKFMWPRLISPPCVYSYTCAFVYTCSLLSDLSHLSSSFPSSPLSPTITPSLFHSRLETHLFRITSTFQWFPVMHFLQSFCGNGSLLSLCAGALRAGGNCRRSSSIGVCVNRMRSPVKNRPPDINRTATFCILRNSLPSALRDSRSHRSRSGGS